jgi:hypothetical protein
MKSKLLISRRKPGRGQRQKMNIKQRKSPYRIGLTRLQILWKSSRLSRSLPNYEMNGKKSRQSKSLRIKRSGWKNKKTYWKSNGMRSSRPSKRGMKLRKQLLKTVKLIGILFIKQN